MPAGSKRRKQAKKKTERKDGEPEPKRLHLDKEKEDVETAPTCLATSLPFELVAEILLYSKSPRDLLAVSRTCKYLYAILASHRAAYVWKNARLDCLPSPLPEPMPGQSEQSHAAFVFGGSGKCEMCGKNTDGPYTSYALRVTLCPSVNCKSLFENTMMTTQPSIVPSPHYTMIANSLTTLESSKCFFLNPQLRHHPDLSYTYYWPDAGCTRKCRAPAWASAVQEYLSIASDAPKLSDYLINLNLRTTKIETYQKYCVGVRKWMDLYLSEYKPIKEGNEKWAKAVAAAHQFVYWDLMNTFNFGTMVRAKSRSLELLAPEDWERVADATLREIDVILVHRNAKRSEASYRTVRAAVEKFHNTLKHQPEFAPLPSLSAFRTLDIVKAIQTPEMTDAEKRFKGDPLVKTMLATNLTRWREDVREHLRTLLDTSMPPTKNPCKNQYAHPAERISARFVCKRCDDVGGVDHCLDFAGVCTHECKINPSMPRKQREHWKEWSLKLFTVDEKAKKTLSKLADSLGLKEEDKNALEQFRSSEAYIHCKSCPGRIIMHPSDVVGHCHRHDDMDFVVLPTSTAAEDLPHHGLNPGLAREILKIGKKVLEANLQKNFGCRHCPPAESELASKLLSPSGLRSHLHSSHSIDEMRDEDVFQIIIAYLFTPTPPPQESLPPAEQPLFTPTPSPPNTNMAAPPPPPPPQASGSGS